MNALRPDFLVLVTLLIVMLLVVDRHVAPPPECKEPVSGAQGVAGGGSAGGMIAIAPDPENGRSLFGQTCTSCHGAHAQGLPHQGVDLRVSKFIAELDDSQLVKFLKTGRQPKDPKSVRGLLMPPRGGNPSLVDMELTDIVAFLRVVQKEALGATGGPLLTSAAPLQGSVETE